MFNDAALEVFHYQYNNNPLYKRFADSLSYDVSKIKHYSEIPFLPIEFFKTHTVLTGIAPVTHTFKSSGTTGAVSSSHFITDISVYEKGFKKAFELFYGNVADYCILALLPSYLERENSSLVYMVSNLIKESKNISSGFYLNDLSKLSDVLAKLNNNSLPPLRQAQGDSFKMGNTKVMLIGVSFALLELAERFPQPLKNIIIMETGGMKGRRKELVREEFHSVLCNAFRLKSIHSEYGMTELLSQAYSKGEGKFFTPPWMKILIRDTDDSLSFIGNNKTGGINIIDLANINSCAFIATQDLGKTNSDDSFEVIGRFDNSDIRGCNLMVI